MSEEKGREDREDREDREGHSDAYKEDGGEATSTSDGSTQSEEEPDFTIHSGPKATPDECKEE